MGWGKLSANEKQARCDPLFTSTACSFTQEKNDREKQCKIGGGREQHPCEEWSSLQMLLL